MKVVKNKTKIIQDISLLYELSLAVGTSLNINENCENFCRVLMTRKNLSSIRIWMKNSDDSNYQTIYSLPAFRNIKKHLSNKHYIIKRLQKTSSFSVSIADKKLHPDILDYGFKKGSCVFFKLSDFGFINIQTDFKEKRFSNIELSQLRQVMDKFAISLKACLSHQQLKESNTKIQLAEIELGNREEMFHSLFTQSPFGIIIGHEEGKYLANQRFCKMIGCTVEDFRQLKISDFSPLDEEKRIKPQIKQIRNNEMESVHLTKQYIRLDGTRFWGNVFIVPLKNYDGTFKTHISFITDITDKTLAQQALKESELRFRSLYEQSPMGVVIEVGNKFLMPNKKFCEILGYRFNELRKFKLEDITHPDDLKLHVDKFKKLRKGLIPSVQIQKRYIHKKGHVVWANITISMILNAAGEMKSQIAIIEDITEQKIVAEILKSNERKLKEAQKLANIGFWELDLETQKVTWSDQTYRIYKRDKKKAPMQYDEYLNHIHPDDKERYISHNVQLLVDGKQQEMYMQEFREDGQVFYSRSFRQAKVKDGKVVKIFGTIQDITKQKLNELEREKLLKEVEEVNRELQNFAYVVSHDLKAPLRAIASLSQWIMEDYHDQLDDSGKEQLGLLVGRVGRMHNFINGILEYSRIGRKAHKKDQVDLQELVKNIIDILQAPQNISIVIRKKLPNYGCERLRMEQLFQNLIGNAIKYNDKKKGKIEIDYEASNSHHIFYIKDNGPGIDEKYFDKIFQIFQTLQPRDEIESTGIGLTIVKRIIELYDGTISLSSTVGKGTTFKFSLKK